jgi:hypothetical protein
VKTLHILVPGERATYQVPLEKEEERIFPSGIQIGHSLRYSLGLPDQMKLPLLKIIDIWWYYSSGEWHAYYVCEVFMSDHLGSEYKKRVPTYNEWTEMIKHLNERCSNSLSSSIRCIRYPWPGT